MIILKKVTENDISLLTAVKERAFKEEFKMLGFVSEEMISMKWHQDMMSKSIYYSIILEEKIIGGVNIFKFNEGYYLCSLFIDLILQNRGIGSKVITQLEKLHNDRNKWQLETPSSSVKNHYFYEKLGYKYVKDMVPDGAPAGFSLRIYEKMIPGYIREENFI